MIVLWLFSLFQQHDMNGELQPGPLGQDRIWPSVLSVVHCWIVKTWVVHFRNKIQQYIQKFPHIQDKTDFGHNGLKHSTTNITQAAQIKADLKHIISVNTQLLCLSMLPYSNPVPVHLYVWQNKLGGSWYGSPILICQGNHGYVG